MGNNMMTLNEMKLAEQNRFWAKVQKTDSCWLWTAAKTDRGYGSFCNRFGHNVGAHIFSFELHKGQAYRYVCHSCDNPACVNPDHLFLGSQSDNMADCKNKERNFKPKGELNGTTVLTEEIVRLIKAKKGWKHGEKTAWARKYGVTNMAIHKIVIGKSWSHI